MPEKTELTTNADAGSESPTDREVLYREIEQRAYVRYCDRGCVPGGDVEDWLTAEQEVLAEYGSREASAPSEPASETPNDRPSRRGSRNR